MRPFALLGPVAAAVLATAACASSSPYAATPSAQPSPAPSASPVAVSPAATGTEIQVGSSRLGQILVDSKGRTLYLFVADSGATSSCNSSACVQYWPPVLTAGAPTAGAGANAALLGTTQRKEGTTQVTYGRHRPGHRRLRRPLVRGLAKRDEDSISVGRPGTVPGRRSVAGRCTPVDVQ